MYQTLLSLLTLMSLCTLPYPSTVNVNQHTTPYLSSCIGRGWISSGIFSPDGQILAIASSTGIWVYAADTLDVVRVLPDYHGGVSDIAFSSDGFVLSSR
jgi:WD40 repeat protein